MMAYTQNQREPTCKELFKKKITAIQRLQNVYQDSAFIAIGTEHVGINGPNDRVLHRVSLAYLPPLRQQSYTTLSTAQPCLQDFYETNHIQTLALNINVGRYGNCVVPARPPHRFGEEQHVDLPNLEAAIIAFITRYSDKVNLVLIGFAMETEWSYMSKFFPRATRYFSAWMDLCDLEGGSASPVGAPSTFMSLLGTFRYQWNDIRPYTGNPQGSVAHSVGHDAVAICALANALLVLKTYQKPTTLQRRARAAAAKKGAIAPDAPNKPTDQWMDIDD
ncbi:hypothetical protein Hte_007207 [Hypoxylon texense]